MLLNKCNIIKITTSAHMDRGTNVKGKGKGKYKGKGKVVSVLN
jgi:hypothetical protein